MRGPWCSQLRGNKLQWVLPGRRYHDKDIALASARLVGDGRVSEPGSNDRDLPLRVGLLGLFVSGSEVSIIFSQSDTTVIRSGDDILVNGSLCGTYAFWATVTNTSLIHFYNNGSSTQRITISLAGGPFAPGLDSGPSPEIDFAYGSALHCAWLIVEGTPETDYITWGGGESAMANLNADEADGIDADLVAAACAWGGASGGDGNDVLSAAGGAGTGGPAAFSVKLIGGSGDDLMLGGAGPDKMEGEGGADRLRGGGFSDPALKGGAGSDSIKGAGGADRLFGEGGRDLLVGGKGEDRLEGGPGFDTCKGGPGRDKFLSCEMIID